MSLRPVTVARRAAGFLLLMAVALDSGLFFWLLSSASSARQWILGVFVSILIPAGLYGLYRLLDLAEFRGSPPGRHHK